VRKYEKCCKYITMLRDSMGSTNDEEEKRDHPLTNSYQRSQILIYLYSVQVNEIKKIL
jgi:hypothetical protein